MTYDKLFPILNMIVCFLASGVYYASGRPDKGSYWLLGGLIGAVVTFWIK